MILIDLIVPEAVLPSLRVTGKKALLQEMSERAGVVSGLAGREIFDAVLQRERLGSTGVGNGVAIPHGKLSRCERIFGVFARLEKPIEFEAMDGEPVDLVFLLIASEIAGADHLKALARVARFLRDPKTAARLRMTRGADALHAILMQAGQASHAA
ncbi:PTS sugar transporter subunit IIA [Lichenihabitans sp. Uapishka_5]|uniref:PTS sugar transporter subunit IIA n=1 Tax=Lichenihabitans sp. Uapishka_5 TaxID=3037302 RepID=UPI0029E7E0D7|nr:PTS sugar transporter subunit IIA [Lichenihabitans sp. Uapishka_5]MDX7951417.1 PTS sugar transporter subunit IIA [Lichenihabitans sp. Uapishka_5]